MIKAKTEITQNEVSVIREIMLASPKNVNKRKLVRVFSTIMSIIMVIYTVTCFLDRAIGYLLLGLAFTIFFV